MEAGIQTVRAKVQSYSRIVAREAVELLRRRGLSYAVLAVTLAAGSLYVSGVRPVLATSNGQAPKPATDDHDSAYNQIKPLQAVTRQSGTNPDESSSQDNTNEQQWHTSVTVNGADIPVPANGEVHKTMTSDGGTTSVSVSHNSSGGSSSYSSLNVQVFSRDSASQEGN